MHPELMLWVELYFLASVFENQEYQIYRDAGAEGDDLQVFALLKAKHMAWLDAKSKGDAMAGGR